MAGAGAVGGELLVVRYLCQFRGSQRGSIGDALVRWMRTRHDELSFYTATQLCLVGRLSACETCEYLCDCIELSAHAEGPLPGFVWHHLAALLGSIDQSIEFCAPVHPSADSCRRLCAGVVDGSAARVSTSDIGEHLAASRDWWRDSVLSASSLGEFVTGVSALRVLERCQAAARSVDWAQFRAFEKLDISLKSGPKSAGDASEKEKVWRRLVMMHVSGYDCSVAFSAAFDAFSAPLTSTATVHRSTIVSDTLKLRRLPKKDFERVDLSPARLQLLTFQVIVCCHLFGQDSLFVLRALQVLCLHDSEAADACLGLLSCRNINVPRAIRLAELVYAES